MIGVVNKLLEKNHTNFMNFIDIVNDHYSEIKFFQKCISKSNISGCSFYLDSYDNNEMRIICSFNNEKNKDFFLKTLELYSVNDYNVTTEITSVNDSELELCLK